MSFFNKISAVKAQEILHDSNAVLVDIRDYDSFSNGHVSGAIHLSQENIAGFIKNTKPEQPILVMCYHGNSSQSVAMYLCQQGFQEVYSINGGYEGWHD